MKLSLLFFSLLSLSYLQNLTTVACNTDDESGLLRFKSGIKQDPSGLLTSWKSGTDYCTWAGVSCLFGTHVTSLSLIGQLDEPNSYLTDTISPSLSKLQYLDDIYFQDLRNISGPFPNFLFNLPNLLFVYIENSKLSGQLPETIGNLTRLDVFSFEGNWFTEKIPTSISKLTQLTQLKFGGNLLTSNIPDGIRQLKNLTVLSLQRNQLSGTITNFFSSFNNLRWLQLSHNKFSGEVPASISSLAPKLAHLEKGHNALKGQIPNFLDKFITLYTLDLSWNYFSGTVPKTFTNLTKIFNLDLLHNMLVDPFPAMKVKGIEALDLSYNRFRLGGILSWVTSSPIIYSLKLAKC